MPDLPAQFWIAAITSVLFVGIAKAGFGGGVGVLATPLLALAVPVSEAAALLLPILIVVDIFSVYHYRGDVDRLSIRVLLPAALVGVAVGALFFNLFSDNERVLQILIGLIALAFLAYQLGRNRITAAVAGSRPSRNVGRALGVTAGFTSTLAHVGGPPIAIYLLPQRLPRTLYVGTTALFFLIINVVKLIPYAALGLLRIGNVPVTLLLIPVAFIGVRLGIWLNHHFTDVWFNRVVYVLLFVTAVQLILGESIIALFATS
ncbi:MAG: sulfite exporter TauE/SafE family protein [Anaerolineae bacterium]|nr:sulfite exporter TauE/SafE family protein [Anaerolineae bacterium]MCO5204769.1 sulfite exporter TauE/SafE family protein [Anaerolineae bacterium]